MRLLTLLMLGLDVMTGSRLQLKTPFGLSVLEAGRFYGIGNEALGIYGVSALVAAAWLALRVRRRWQGRRAAAGVVTVIALFAVFASGWPGFGGKVGGTIAMVPCFVLLAMAVAGIKVNWRRAALIAVSGLALFAVFALVNYLVPATGKSDIGTFAGNLIHGQGGGLLLRKINSNVGSLTVNAFGPVVPAVMLLTGLMLWRPSAFSLRTAPQAYEAQPLSRVLMGVVWLVLLLGWLAEGLGDHRPCIRDAIRVAAGYCDARKFGISRSAGTLSWYRPARTFGRGPAACVTSRPAERRQCNTSYRGLWPARFSTPSGGRE